ncbi:Lhr family ATP dependent helicase [Thermomonas haemolytica]|uniref:Lhr family ATP dependent helicase n=1 Tax=Thermomonas haemolytica TaxID=141949 RepID=A0A4R3NBE6_9GAMM|nr:Lhr family ATP dependent helicase [Thermomonas haemolytica]
MPAQLRIAYVHPVQTPAGAAADNPGMALHPVLAAFHPAVAGWFARRFPAPTPAQQQAWPAIRTGADVLVAAPTGAGKTLTGFLAALDALVREGLTHGLPDATCVLYVSPLKALSNDIHRNLEAPLAGIAAELARLGLPEVAIRTAVRTGDTPAGERAALRRQPPHVLVTTPESLYILLNSASGRAMLGGVHTVIVDEIHALVQSKRGSHLALSLARLDALTGRRAQRIGLSATQKPVQAVARFLAGTAPLPTIIDIGHERPRDLALELPPTPLEPVMSHPQWAQVYARIAELAAVHATTLVFVNTRRMAERTARQLAELLGEQQVAAHHGSLAKELRLDAEQRLKRGALKVLVATASLELGIDIGEVELVCQIGSPRSIAAFLQRVGRSGHHVGGVPKGRLFPTSRDELLECAALLDAVRRGELDALRMPLAPLDVLAQQIVAEVAACDWDEDALYACVRSAYPYADLPRERFDALVRMLDEGFASRFGTRARYLHRDAVQRVLRARKGARLIATQCGGTIPDLGDYSVVLEPQAITIGSVTEDFAIESLAGDVFQLGNASYRVLRVEAGVLRVEDAQGQPPSIPFWVGEAPGRTDELSIALSRLRAGVQAQLEQGGAMQAAAWLRDGLQLPAEAAQQISDYAAAQWTGFGMLPTREHLALERFFDESGGTQLIIHAPYGSRINKAWGLALRKRFCRKFNFELQAAATEDCILLSLSTSHSFPLAEVLDYLHPASAREVLVQALLDAPLFPARFRWNAATALALPRFSGGRRVMPQLQRMRAEDLMATVFPDQVACLENIVGERQVPDHPLVAQTLEDCLTEAMDVDGWLALLRALEQGRVQVTARDLTGPSPFASEVLGARPYAFLDDAPLEERRTRAVAARRFGLPEQADDLGRLDAGAIASAREDAWPQAAHADELHAALCDLGVLTADEAAACGWLPLLQALAAQGRATQVTTAAGARWVAAERLPLLRALHPEAACAPPLALPPALARDWPREEALRELVRARLSALAVTDAQELAAGLALPVAEVELALLALEQEGYALRGHFAPDAGAEQWCERTLLARIHRHTVARLRREIEPVAVRDYVRFLCDWQHLSAATRVRGPEALAGVLSQLEGFEAPAQGWETELLPARVQDYTLDWLDALCGSGRIAWARLRAGGEALVRAAPLVLLPRPQLARWMRLAAAQPEPESPPSSRAQRVEAALQAHGALFFEELRQASGLLEVELEDALGELVARGRVGCDSFAGLRALLQPASRRAPRFARHGRRAALRGIADAGRWARVGPALAGLQDLDPQQALSDREHVARVLLRRWGVVCWPLLAREAPWLPPWRELLRVYQRLEARGEIRGGRFLAGVAGPQFALPEAVAGLRAVRARAPDGALLVVSAADPLNLAGLLLPGEKVPRQPGARLLLRDGVVIATQVGGVFAPRESLAPDALEAARHALRRAPGERLPLPPGASPQADPLGLHR